MIRSYDNFMNEKRNLNLPDEYYDLKNINNKYRIEFDKYSDIKKKLIPFFSKIINSNNLEDINKVLDLLPKGVHISDAQFLYQRIYVIKEDNLKPNGSYFEEVKDNILTIFDEIIEQNKIIKELDEKSDKIIRNIIKTNDLDYIRMFYNVVSNLPISFLLYNAVNKLHRK